MSAKRLCESVELSRQPLLLRRSGSYPGLSVAFLQCSCSFVVPLDHDRDGRWANNSGWSRPAETTPRCGGEPQACGSSVSSPPRGSHDSPPAFRICYRRRSSADGLTDGCRCDGCRRVKEKCEGGVPCRRCLRYRRQCVFTHPDHAEKIARSSSISYDSPAFRI